MSNMKHDAVVNAGITIGERVRIPRCDVVSASFSLPFSGRKPWLGVRLMTRVEPRSGDSAPEPTSW